MELIRLVNNWFWDESHWFPPGLNWNHLKNNGQEQFPQFDDLKLPIIYAFVVLAIRAVFEWSIARPLGCWFGIRDRTNNLPNIYHRIISSASIFFNPSKACADGQIASDNSKKARKFIPKSTLDKFAESCWRFTFYCFIFFYGLWTMWNKSYFWNTSDCWYGYPLQPLTSDIYWYYMMELSFYWSLIISQFVDVKRKDFWINFIHHIATVLLLTFSWADNLVRMGSLILLTHDAADFWMEAAKMARYCQRTTLCNVLFTIFTLIWFVTRCFYLPFWILFSTMTETVIVIGFYEAYYILNALLILLQILHIFWSILILRILISAVRSGEADDARSDSEEDSNGKDSTRSNKED